MRQDWDKEDIIKEFEIEPSELDGVEILYSFRDDDSYEGDAFFLLKKGEDLYEVHANHCSCHGFEDQWDPEKTSIEALKLRLSGGGFEYHRKQIQEFLDSLESAQ